MNAQASIKQPARPKGPERGAVIDEEMHFALLPPNARRAFAVRFQILKNSSSNCADV